MKFTLTFLVLILSLVAFSLGAPGKGSTKAALQKQKACLQKCPTEDEIKPICGGNAEKKISFANECVLQNYNCENDADLKMISQGECPGGGGIRLS